MDLGLVDLLGKKPFLTPNIIHKFQLSLSKHSYYLHYGQSVKKLEGRGRVWVKHFNALAQSLLILLKYEESVRLLGV